MKKSAELLKNTAIISIGKMGTQIVNFLLLPLYTSRLTTKAYGSFDFIITISAFIIPIITMLMEESMFRFLIDCKDEREKEKIISHTFIFCSISLIFASCLGILFIMISKYKMGYIILLYCISMFFIALSNALSRGLGKITLFSLSNFISSTVIIVLNILLILLFNLGFSALIISNVISNIATALFVLIKLRVWKYITIGTFNKKQLQEMLKFSVPLVPNTICWSIINASDRLVIMAFSGASINGLYAIAYKFPSLINTFYNFFNIAWRETSAKIVRDNDISYFEKIYEVIRNGLFSVTILLITGLHFIYPLFINDNYYESIYYVPILAISVYYMSISAFYGGIFTAYKDTKILGSTSFWAAAINLFIDLALYKFIGVYAAAISTLTATLFLYWYRRLESQNFLTITHKRSLFIEIIFVIIVFLFYIDKDIINIITFVICLIGSLWLNKDTLISILSIIKNRRLR